MMSIIDRMDLKSWLRPLREGDMYEINGKNYYSEELLFDHLPKTDEFEEDVDETADERLDKLNATVNELEGEVDELMTVRKMIYAERDEARAKAEEYRDMLQSLGFLLKSAPLPWEGE